MKERLNLHQVCAQWVPHSLQPQQEACRMAHCIDDLQRYAREGNEFLAGDESWCHHFEPELKQRSLQWKHPGLPSPKESKAIHTSAGKVMLMFFFDQDGPLPSERLPATWDNSECPALLSNLDHPSPTYQIETTRQAHPWGYSAPRQCKTSYGQHNHGTLAEIQVGGSWSPSMKSRPLSLRLCQFWSSKKRL